MAGMSESLEERAPAMRWWKRFGLRAAAAACYCQPTEDTRMNAPIDISLKIAFGDNGRLGPGKMALLEEIARAGSISGAGRALGMSYRRAWLLVDALNAMFAEPCVRTAAGGVHGGGATLTPFGGRVLAAYRRVERETAARVDEAFGELATRPTASRGAKAG